MNKDEAYWEARGAGYREDVVRRRGRPATRKAFEAQETALRIALMAQCGAEHVFEFGCGYGRVSRIVQEVLKPEVHVAMDLSEAQLANAREHCGGLGVQFYQGNEVAVPSLGMRAEWWDVVVAAEVLMHMAPQNAFIALSVLVSLRPSALIHVDVQAAHRGHGNSYGHDFPAMYQRLGVTDVYQVPVFKQVLTVARP